MFEEAEAAWKTALDLAPGLATAHHWYGATLWEVGRHEESQREMRQDDRCPKMPIFYFTALMGAAMGLEQASSWWGKHLIDPTPLLAAID